MLFLSQRGPQHVELMKELLAGVNKDEVLQYVLALLDELLTGAHTRFTQRHCPMRGAFAGEDLRVVMQC